jgi:tripartite-type tricarboxylate transporter receptor subunit TctC
MVWLGFAGFISDTFHGMLAPAGTPPEIVDRLAAVLMDSLKRPEFREKLRTLGFDVIGKGPEAMRRRISEEVTRYRDIIAKAGIERV